MRPTRTRSEAASPTGAARKGEYHGISASNAADPATTASRFRNSRRCVRSLTTVGEGGSGFISPLNARSEIIVGFVNYFNRRCAGIAGKNFSAFGLRDD